MKNVNIKKVVAGAAALAIAAGSLGAVVSAANVADSSYTTPNGLARADMFNAQGAPSYNIVVGSTGHASDVVWAANIAAAIGKKAYNVSTASATGGDVVVEVGAEGVTTVSGDGKLFNTEYMGEAAYDQYTVKKTQFGKLFEGDIDYTDRTDNEKTLNNVKETISVTVDSVAFDSDSDVKEIVAKLSAGNVIYELNLGSTGIALPLVSGGDHDVTIPFMGRMYKIRSATDTKVELVLDESKEAYNFGDTFEVSGAGTYDSSNLTVEVSSITNTGDGAVLLRLKDNGGVISSKTVKSGKSTNFDGKASDITVTGVYYAENNAGYIEVSIGKDVLTLEAGTFDAFTDADGREWSIEFDSTVDYLKTVTLTNLDGWDDALPSADYKALRMGESALLPNDLAEFKFVGLKSKDMYGFETNNGVIKWSDQDNAHEVPIYTEKAIISGNSTMKVTIDGKDYYITHSGTSGTPANKITIRESNNLESDPIKGYIFASTPDAAAFDWSYGTTKVDLEDMSENTFIGIPSDLSPSITHYFYLYNAGSKFALAVSAKLSDIDDEGDGTLSDAEAVSAISNTGYIIGKSGSWRFAGTYTNAGAGIDLAYYEGQETTKGKSLANFKIVDADTSDIDFYFDPANHKLSNFDDYSAAEVGEVATISEKVYYDSFAGPAYDFTLDDYDSEDLREGIATSGTELKISNRQISVNMPEEKQEVEFFLGGDISSSTTTLGSEVTLTTPGEIVDADGIKVKLVSAPQGSATTYTPAAFGNIAYLDTDTLPAGNKIIVGGWMVNEQAKTLGLEDLVTKAGDYVAGKNAQGNIVVAGFHKEDTANAAKELITAIEAMN